VGEEGVGDVHDAVDRDAERAVAVFGGDDAGGIVDCKGSVVDDLSAWLKTTVNPG